MSSKLKKTFLRVLIFVLIFGWFFSGWPQIWENPPIPPKIEKASAAGWLTGWDKRVQITVSTTNIDADLTHFPLMLELGTSVGTGNEDISFIFDELQSDAKRLKIAVTKNDGTTELYVEIEKWVDADETAILWVSSSTLILSGTADTTLYLYYDVDHEDNTTYVGDDPNDAASKAVWNSDYGGVWHMNAQVLEDSTGNVGDSDSANPGTVYTGRIGSAIDYNGTTNKSIIPTATSIDEDVLSSLTYTAWVNGDSWVRAMEKGNQYFLLNFSGAGSCGPLIKDAGTNRVANVGTLNTGTWYRVGGRYSFAGGSTGTLDAILNGAINNTTNSYTHAIDSANTSLWVGSDDSGAEFDGRIDELRISRVVRPVAWIKAEYYSDIDGLVDWGAEETPGTLSVDIVDADGNSVVSPSMAMGSVTFSLVYQTATGTLGISSQKLRVNNTTATPAWTMSIAADSGPTSLWSAGAPKYDFNDPTANAVDGPDADSYGGQMTLDASVGTLTPQGGCSNTGVTKGSSAPFSEGVTNSITLLSASGSASTGCYWDLTGVSVSQTIPKEQTAGGYSINMTLTVVAN